MTLEFLKRAAPIFNEIVSVKWQRILFQDICDDWPSRLQDINSLPFEKAEHWRVTFYSHILIKNSLRKLELVARTIIFKVCILVQLWK